MHSFLLDWRNGLGREAGQPTRGRGGPHLTGALRCNWGRRMDGRGTWIALKFGKGGTLGSAGLSINLLTNILYRQAAALHPNLPLPAIAHPRTCCSLRPTTTCALLRVVHDPTSPSVLNPTSQPPISPGDTVTQGSSTSQTQIACPSTSPPSDTWLLGHYFKTTRPGVDRLVQTPPYVISILPRQNIHGLHGPHGPSFGGRCHRCTVCALCVFV
ncbi:hypothetical protein QBC45DRAFT_82858 [Copromyces sp. CBS 386.78]|nr:hypothetical protein QBC45DRAFT_82858 [Copromyces sp. CBS 386.78]